MTTIKTDHTNCPFCRSNGLLKGEILATSPEAYLIENSFSKGDYLIIPEIHTESIADLPDNWWSNIQELVLHIPDLPNNYNLAMNYGELSGQSIKHLHFWIIPRVAGKPSSGKGLTRLIDEVDSNPSIGKE